MKTKKLLIITSMALLLFSQYISAKPAWESRVPNGSVNSCFTCHSSVPDLNSFGNDFKDNNVTWNAALAAKNSDGGDFTNGQELADPDGSFNPIPGAQVTNPGSASSEPVLQAPSISITSPTNEEVFDAPFTGPITASTGDPVEGITKIEFFSGASSLGTVDALPFSLPVNLSDGVYTLTATATDYLGATGNSEAITITVGGSATLDPLIGGTPVDGLEGWYLSEWFGYYSTTLAPWLFHAEHGWIYRDTQSTNASTFFYDDVMSAWWWTNETDYPFLFALDPVADNAGTDIGSEWLWYFEESQGPRLFAILTGASAGTNLAFGP